MKGKNRQEECSSLPVVLLVTATQIEAQAVLGSFTNATGKKIKRQIHRGKTYYDLGVVSAAKILMVQSEIGSGGPGGSLMTVRNAIDDVNPDAVILVGIAFGVDPKKQNIGDVLVSEMLLPYESQRIGGIRKTVITPRGERVKASTYLLDKFRSGVLDWKVQPVHFGLVVSGEKLIDNPSFRDQIIRLEPETIGGEMEGPGLYTAATDAKRDWIIVKGICDWADGHKRKNKLVRQKKAARCAVEFVQHVIRLGSFRREPEQKLEPTESIWHVTKSRYLENVSNHYDTTRLLGHPKPISIQGIYTDLYVLDRLTALRRFDLSAIQANFIGAESHTRYKRQPAIDAVEREKRLFILGKPGSGKTTFLKYLTLKACEQKIPKTPIFVSLKEWADSELELNEFIVHIFDTFGFPNASQFIDGILKTGDALVLFDGLDEVNQEENERQQMIVSLTNFAKRYRNAQICLTCRIAAVDFSFDQFAYFEIADFDKRQMQSFVEKWYEDDNTKANIFWSEFNKPGNRGLRQLGQTPLLLALLCLAFDETLTFPLRRVDIYKDALDALLKRWDASRGIRRDRIYRLLSPGRKEQLLTDLAAINFNAQRYFIAKDLLSEQITRYLSTLPEDDIKEVPDGEAILKAIEAQHGVLTERAHNVYSFLHLTFQEYLTARHIVENASHGTLDELVKKHLHQDNWREVFLQTASLLNNADYLFKLLLDELNNVAYAVDSCSTLLRWISRYDSKSKSPGVSTRAVLSLIALDSALIYNQGSKSEGALISAINAAYYLIADGELKAKLSAAGSRVQDEFEDMLRLRADKVSMDQSSDRAAAARIAQQARSAAREEGSLFENLSFDYEEMNDGELRLRLIHFRTLARASVLGVRLRAADLEREWILGFADFEQLAKYFRATQLTAECLRLAAVSDRQAIDDMLLLPPKATAKHKR